MIIHVVKQGETADSIARQYGVSLAHLVANNGITNWSQLAVGQALLILFPEKTHVVQPGETLDSIARANGVSIRELFQNNFILFGRELITPGQTLVLSYNDHPEGPLSVNGYAYPFVNRDLLRSTLPFLTYLTPFTYGLTAAGGLLDLTDAELIRLSGEYGVQPLMHLSTMTEEGGFSNTRAHLVLTNQDVQNRLIEEILDNLQRKGYYGLDVDFEFIYPEDRDAYTGFIAALRDRLNPLGYEVVVALAPKTSDTQPGTLYEGHDYGGMAQAANAVFLMTYEWGYTYGPPMAVAPINAVRRVLDYAVTKIPREKIFMGMPNYAYDWPLPFLQGTTRAQSISNVRAVDLAIEYGAAIEFDEEAQTPHFRYYNRQGDPHEVWFEDVRSIKAKLDLVREYGFQGVGYWNMMRPFPGNWTLLNALFRIRQAS
ncbi:MAG: glycosyl hydrolase family 18 protein [Oscillospiraceae bacterium]|nr:glycosyl hydrolase family 18 protein [Oscillospiraceae bacterium]